MVLTCKRTRKVESEEGVAVVSGRLGTEHWIWGACEH